MQRVVKTEIVWTWGRGAAALGRLAGLAGLAITGALAGGCVSGQTHEMLRAAHAKTLEENKDLLAENALLRGRLDASGRDRANLDSERSRFEAERAAAAGDRTNLEAQLRLAREELARQQAALAAAQQAASAAQQAAQAAGAGQNAQSAQAAQAAALAAAQAQQLDAARQRIAELEARLREALAAMQAQPPAPPTAGPLSDRPTVNELVKRITREFGLTYDEATGMLGFPADLLFPSGEDTLLPGAREPLRRLAMIIDHPEVRDFRIRIVGHTDKRPIQLEATARRFPSNWHLAAARAISVMAELLGVMSPGKDSLGVERLKDRFEPASRGQRDLLDPGDSAAAHRRNRRVEVFFVPPPRLTGRALAAGASLPVGAAAAASPESLK